MQSTTKFYLHAGWRKKHCVFRFPRQPLGRIVADADWVLLRFNQTNIQLQPATLGTLKVLPHVENSRIPRMMYKLITFSFLAVNFKRYDNMVIYLLYKEFS